MNRNSIENLLTRYLKKETSAEENLIIEKWLEENRNAESGWQDLDRVSKDRWLADVLSRIKSDISDIKTKESGVVKRKAQSYRWYSIVGAAAVLLICFSVYIVWPNLEKHLPAAALTSISVPDHQKKMLKLSDGTKVWLNAGAELRFPKTFDGKSRTVFLSGEAYFDVKHDAGKPFLIYTGKVLTTVLGTAFNIREDRHLHLLEVTVTRGKVSVANDGKLIGILTPNKQVNLDLLSGKVIEKTVDIQTVIAWQDNNEMRFDDVTLGEAAELLERHFHIKINFSNNKLKKCRFSGTTLKTDKLEKILDVIAGFNHATWRWESDGQVIIHGEGCN